MSRHGRYLRLCAAAFAGTLAVAAAVNVAVDPYGLFGTPRVAGFNAVKPEASSHSRVAKPYQVAAARPATLVVGNSRPEMGLDPASACWSAAERPVYNLGLPGASFAMQLEALRHGLAAGTVRTVVIGLDFLDFLHVGAVATAGEGGSGGGSPDDWRRRLALGPEGADQWRQRLTDWWRAAVSLDALADSLQTVVAQHDPDAGDLRADGFNPARPYRAIIAAEGQRVLFAQKQDELRGLFSRPGLHLPAAEASPELRALDALLADLAARGVTPHLFLNPYHAAYLSAVDHGGLWPDFLRWKADLLAVTAAHGVPLWDFNTLGPFAREAVPPPGDRRTTLRWFWEPAHYTAALGERMLGALLGRDCAAPADAPGERLSVATLAEQQRSLRPVLDAWKAGRVAQASEGGVVPASSR